MYTTVQRFGVGNFNIYIFFFVTKYIFQTNANVLNFLFIV